MRRLPCRPPPISPHPPQAVLDCLEIHGATGQPVPLTTIGDVVAVRGVRPARAPDGAAPAPTKLGDLLRLSKLPITVFSNANGEVFASFA